MKATELSRIDNSFNLTQEKIQELQDSRAKMEDSLADRQRQVAKLKSKCDEHDRLAKIELKLATQRANLAWKYYEQCEAEYEVANSTMQQYQVKADKYADRVKEAENVINAPDTETAERQARVDKLLEEVQEQLEKKRVYDQEYKDRLPPLKQLERNKADIHGQRKDTEKRLQMAKKRLQDARDQIASGARESEEARRLEELKKTEEALEESKKTVQQHQQKVSDALRQYEEAEPMVSQARAHRLTVENQLKDAQANVRRLESSSGNGSMAMFGQNVKAVYDAVERAKRQEKFRGEVVGPIGHYLKVRPGKEKFATIAAKAIGYSLFDRFVVTNNEDRQALNQIRIKAGCTVGWPYGYRNNCD